MGKKTPPVAQILLQQSGKICTCESFIRPDGQTYTCTDGFQVFLCPPQRVTRGTKITVITEICLAFLKFG